MTPINSTLPTFAALDAQMASADTEDANKLSDDFSALLGSLIVPVSPPQAPLPPQPCQPAPVEAQIAPGVEVQATPAPTPTPAPAQPLEFVGQQAVTHGPQVEGYTTLVSTPVTQLDTILEKPAIEQPAPMVENTVAETTVIESAPAPPIKEAVLPLKETGSSEQINPASFSDKLNLTASTKVELPPSPMPKTETDSIQIQSLPLEKLSASIQVETPKATPETALRQPQTYFDLNFSPSRGIPATFAATINSLRGSGETQPDSQSQPEITGAKTEALPVTTELIQERTSSETGTGAGTSDGSAKDSIAADIAIENPSKSGKARPSEPQFSTEAAVAPHAATASTANTAASHLTAQEPIGQPTESLATQLSHAVRQVAGEVIAHREPRSIRIRLRPEELGEVHINITTDTQGHLSAQISAEHDLTRRAIAGGLDHLRETLEQAGVNVDRLNVSVNQFSSGGTGAQSDAGSQQAARQSATAAHTTSSPTDNLSEGKTSEEEERLLSMRA